MTASPKKYDYANNKYVTMVPPAPGKRGRTKAVINDFGQETIFKLASMGCTKTEIYGFLGIGSNLVSQSAENSEIFNAAYERAQEIAKVRIRQAQYKCLDNGNSAVTIFMSKAVLGMSDGQTAQQPNNMFADFLAQAKRYADMDDDESEEPE